MILQVFTVLDKAVGAYLPPYYSRSKGEGIRSFSDAVSEEGSRFAKHATDFVLMHLGEFDDGTGLYHCGEPQRLISALECLSGGGADAGIERAQAARNGAGAAAHS